MRILSRLVLFAAAGCAQPEKQHRKFEMAPIFDGIWDVIHKNKRVWIDSMELVDGGRLESKLRAFFSETTVTGAKFGIVLKCHVAGLDVKPMTAFRQDLKTEPTLSRYFPIMNFTTQWSVTERKDLAEKHSIDFDVLLVNTGQT